MERYSPFYLPGAGSALYFNQCGLEHLATPHGHGPAVRDHYLIHCVLDGWGFFEAGGVQHHVGPGEAFLIRPGEMTYYIADKTDPWSYGWVGFSGSEAVNILEALGGGPILRFSDITDMEKCVRQLMRLHRTTESNPFARQSELYHFFSLFTLSPHIDRSRSPAAVAQAFLQQNHTYAITVEQAATYAGVSRSHLFRLFRQAYGVAPQEYLSQLRLQHAAQLLQDGATVTQAAYSSGFSDLPNFSRRFRQAYGMAPSFYSAKVNEDNPSEIPKDPGEPSSL